MTPGSCTGGSSYRGADTPPGAPTSRRPHCLVAVRRRRLRPMSSLSPAVPRAVRAGGVRARSYVALTKPRIIELLLVTTLPTMLVAK